MREKEVEVVVEEKVNVESRGRSVTFIAWRGRELSPPGTYDNRM
jgi:hypothetical protein